MSNIWHYVRCQKTFLLKLVFNDCLIEDFEISCELKVKNTIIWSDGAAAHFKNQYSIASTSFLHIFSEWNFCESYHGKEQHEEVGTVLKQHVWKMCCRSKLL